MAVEYDLGNVMGPQGEQGNPGISVTNAVINEGGHLILTLSNGNTIDAGNTKGEKGDRGEKGEIGQSAYEQAVEGGYTGTRQQFDEILANLNETIIHMYTHTYSDTVHKLTGSGEIIQFKATADFHNGDTFTVNGKPADAVDLTGSPLSASYYLTDSWVLAAFYGGKLHFQGHNLTAQEDLLVNGGFRINQRGQSTYSTAGYSVDCWRLFSQNFTLEVNADSISLIPGDQNESKYFVQYLDNGSIRAGKYTLTVEFEGNITLGYYDEIGKSHASELFSLQSKGVRSYTFIVPENRNNQNCRVVITVQKTTAKIYRAKLEEGAHFTGFTRPDPVLELARCQRYLQVYTKCALFPRYIAGVGCGFGMPIPKMRIKPAVLFNGTLNVNYGIKVNDARIMVNSIGADGLATNEWLDIWAALPSGSSAPTHPLLWFEGDSQLILSAEL